MPRKIASTVFLLVAMVIALGAVGHDSQAVRVAGELARSPLGEHEAKIILLVWHFTSGCMFVLGAICAWVWWRGRRGERSAFAASDLIGVFYAVTGLWSVWYSGVAFFWLFFVLGLLLILASLPLRRTA